MQIKKRSEVNPEFTWDLSPIFECDAAWQAAYEEAKAAVGELEKLPGTLGESAEALKAGMDALTGISRKVELVYDYAFLRKAGDNGDPVGQDMEARAISLLVAMETAAAFVDPEILSIDPEKLNAWLRLPELSLYRHQLEDIARGRAHTLDAAGERMMAMLGEAAQTPGNVFEMFESVDMRFPPVHDEQGNEAPLTHGSFGVYRESASQDVRREAFETYFGEFAKYINTLAATYGGAVKMNCFQAGVRRFDGACEAALFGNNVPVSLYDGLIDAVHEALPTMRRYIELRKRVMGLDKLNLYDLYAPMVPEAAFEMPYEKAKALVKDALKPLGERYQSLLDEAFSNRWIDVYENQGKTTGAFSFGVYDAHPYVLLNYADKLDDAFTLAHELGHAMHSWHSDHAQEYANHDYRIFVAEVASTVNEVLLTRHLLSQELTDAQRAYILNHFLEGFRTTVFRQTLFAEFERKAHELYQSGQPLTAQTLNQVYHELNALYYDGCEINDFADVEWARIPHFYNAFYVYQYATGFSSAVAIAERILNHDGAVDYLKFLSSGGSDYPIEELKLAGVDLTRPEPVRDAMRMFAESLDALEALLTGREA